MTMLVKTGFLHGIQDILENINCTFGGSGIECHERNFRWSGRWSYNRECARIADMFCCQPGSYMHTLVAEIARTPQSVKSDTEYIATYRQACGEFQRAMRQVPGCGARSAAERPCSGEWGVGLPWQFPGTEQILLDALARRRGDLPPDRGLPPPSDRRTGGSFWERSKGALFVVAVIGILYLGFRIFAGFGTSVARRVRT